MFDHIGFVKGAEFFALADTAPPDIVAERAKTVLHRLNTAGYLLSRELRGWVRPRFTIILTRFRAVRLRPHTRHVICCTYARAYWMPLGSYNPMAWPRFPGTLPRSGRSRF